MAKALEFYGNEESTETQRFVKMFDKLFDCLNVRHPTEHIHKRKPFLRPYTSKEDDRFDVRMYIPINFSRMAHHLFYCSGCRKNFWGI